MLDNTSYFMGRDGFHWFVGVVEDRNDPQKAGRVRVRCVGYHSDSLNEIPTAALPWASVMMPVTAGANSGIGFSPHFLIEGTWVVGFFRDPAKQEPVIMGALPGRNTKETTNFTVASSSAVGGQSLGGGFKDQGVDTKPKGNQEVTYPTQLYIDKTDTNVIAQQAVTWAKTPGEGESHHPSFTVKGGLEVDEAVHTKWSNASGTEIQQAVSTQASSLYPFNHVIETESGHYVEIDDTKNNERIHVYHKTGTFLEIDPLGNIVLKTPDTVNMTTIIGGNSDTYIKGNYSLTVDGNMDVHCTGGNVMEKIATGTKTVDIKGAITHTYQDTLTETITGAVTQTYSDALTLEITGDVTETFSATLTTNITGAAQIKSSAAMTVGGSTISFN